MRAQNAVDSVGEVLRLQIRELRLLRAELHVEEVVVDLRDQGLERHAVFYAGWADQRRDDVARIDEAGDRRGRRNRTLLEVARRMAGCRDLLDALAEYAAPSNDVENLRLVHGNFDCAWSDIVRCCVNLSKLRVHLFLP